MSRLKEILNQGVFGVTAECGPPRGANADVIRKKGELLKGYADAVNVTDNQTAIVRMSSIASCVHLLRMGLEPVMQMVTLSFGGIAVLLGFAADPLVRMLAQQFPSPAGLPGM